MLLRQRPVAIIYQPRTHSATGHTLSEARSNELAAVLSGTTPWIVEDDGIGALSAHPLWSLGRFFPERTLHVRSFSKAYGPDLRLGVLSGPEALVKRIRSWRNFGASWTSRILQQSVAWMLADEGFKEYRAGAGSVSSAAAAPALRPDPARRGAAGSGRVKYLSAGAVGAVCDDHPGRQGHCRAARERCRSGSGQFVRVSTSMLPEHLVDEVADALLIASGREPGAIRSDL
ncbi:aminotransferase class I/II-fold pyridoxal phosphate-dependent enzyme [Erwinia aphidicola]